MTDIVERLRERATKSVQIGFGINDILIEAADEIEKLRKIIKAAMPEKSGHFFICGEAGTKDQMGLPENIFVCPTYGLDGFAVYKKEKDYTAPGW
jgi:hypothetical protein